ncbi:hypothetical protein PUF88_04670 [Lactobacillaceae bacterium L1_55_11]|nr:hypothetical protein [Lactobacillaceae bacterium L1_55_11]
MKAFDDNLVLILGFFGDWLLFVFPLMQGILELQDYSTVIDAFKVAGQDVKKVSNWYWLFPPLKFHLERVRLHKISRSQPVSRVDRQDLMKFEMKAMAWFFVALTGIFKGVGATSEIIDHFDWPNPVFWFWVLNFVFIFVGANYVFIRLRIAKKLASDFDDD